MSADRTFLALPVTESEIMRSLLHQHSLDLVHLADAFTAPVREFIANWGGEDATSLLEAS